MHWQRWGVGYLVVGVLAGTGGLRYLSTRVETAHEALPVYGRVPAFSLVDQTGQPISRETLAGRVWIADFIFTRCAGQCPMMSDRMARLASSLPRRAAVRLVSFSVDPEWDTPEVLARYATAHGAAPDRWSFVTGDRDQMRRLCQEGFRLAMADGEGTPEEPIPPPTARRGAARSAVGRAVADGNAAGGGTITHSVRLVLVDRRGDIRGYYDATDAGELQRLQRDVRALLRRLEKAQEG